MSVYIFYYYVDVKKGKYIYFLSMKYNNRILRLAEHNEQYK